MANEQEQAVIEQLREYDARFTQLMGMLETLPLGKDEKAEAQQRMKALKEKLKADYKVGDTVRGQTAMNEVEKSSLFPAIHESHAGIHVAWNSTPNEKWASELYAARGTIRFYLRQLEEHD